MKKRIFALLLALTALLCVLPVSAEGETESEAVVVSTDIADLSLKNNANGHYVMGCGMNHSPNESFLFANETGGVTLVQYTGNRADPEFTVAEFDEDLDFCSVRVIPITGELLRWGGCCTDGENYYVAYSVFSRISVALLVVEKYDSDWNLVRSVEHQLYNTKTAIDSDFDMVAANGKVFITMNRFMSSGHQANGRLELSAATLEVLFSQLGTAGYDGYCSHSYVPEIVVSGENIYAFDRCDEFPGEAIFMSSFSGSLSNGIRMTAISGMGWRDWGNLGNAIPGPDGTVLAVYNYGPNVGINSEPTNCEVTLYHSGSGYFKVAGSYGSGTPLVASAGGSTGFVLWNPDRYGDETKDDLYYVPYVVNSGSLTVGTVQKAEGHYLSDCEPVTFDGGVLWFTYENGELIFHQLKANSAPTKKIFHTNLQTLQGTEPTCTQTGLTDGLKCRACGEIMQEQQVIPALPHTALEVEAQAPTCEAEGCTAGSVCSVCGTVLAGQEVIEKLPHTESVIPGYPATCTQNGQTDGLECQVCGEVLKEQSTIFSNGHSYVHTPAVAPTYSTPGRTEGTMCSVCGEQTSGGDEVAPLRLRYLTSQLAQGQFLIYYTDPGDAPFWMMASVYDNTGRLTDIKLLEGDSESNCAGFAYTDIPGRVKVISVTKDLYPMADKIYDWKAADYAGG